MHYINAMIQEFVNILTCEMKSICVASYYYYYIELEKAPKESTDLAIHFFIAKHDPISKLYIRKPSI